jgi:oligosaccharide repeat unit polymerase
MYILIYIAGMIIIYNNTKNIFSFQFLFACFLAPCAYASSEEVTRIFSYGILFIAFGGALYNYVSKKPPEILKKEFDNKEFKVGFKSERKFYNTVLILAGASIVISIYYYQVVGISLFSENVGLDRLLNRHAISGSYFYQRLFRVFLPIIVIMYYVLQKCESTKKYYSTSVFILLVATTISLLAFTGMRGNVITFLFTPFLMMIGIVDKKINFAKILILLSIGLIFGGFITKLMYQDVDLLGIVKLIMERLAGGASDGITNMVMDDIPTNGHYYGMTYIGDIGSLFYKLGLTQFEYINYSEYIARNLLGQSYNGEHAAVYLFGELFANFGNPGLVFGSIVVGMIMQFLYIKIFTVPKTVLRFSILIYVHAAVMMIMGGPSISMTIDYCISIFAFYVIFTIMASTNFKNKSNLKFERIQ